MSGKTEKITLKYAVQLADRMLTEVTMRRPTVGDMLDFPLTATSGLGEECALIGHLCDLLPEDMRELDAEDYTALQNQLLRFRGMAIPKQPA